MSWMLSVTLICHPYPGHISPTTDTSHCFHLCHMAAAQAPDQHQVLHLQCPLVTAFFGRSKNQLNPAQVTDSSTNSALREMLRGAFI